MTKKEFLSLVLALLGLGLLFAGQLWGVIFNILSMVLICHRKKNISAEKIQDTSSES